MTTKKHRRQTSQRGTALVAVLWVSIFLSVLLAGTLAITRTELRGVHARGEALKAHTAAQSGFDIGAQLLASGEVQNLNELQRLDTITINEYEISFAPTEESRKLDINLASEETFKTLFTFLGQEPDEAEKLAARIADWRDVDDLPRPNGAEKSDYTTARNNEEIKNRPFYSVEEMALVLGMPTELLNCAAPAFTVFWR